MKILNKKQGKDRVVPVISQEKRTFVFFTIMYIMALSLIAVISIFSQTLIQNYLNNQVSDSHLLNFAARLRTYSQTLSKTALLLERDRDFATNRKEFVNTLKQWEKSHKGLLGGSDFLDLPKNDREDLEQMYKIIEGPYESILEAAELIIAEMYRDKPHSEMELKKYIDVILNYEKSYLLGMELIVFDYDRFSRNRVQNLKSIERNLLIFILLTLALEALLIFYPLAKRIRRTIKGLDSSQKNYRKTVEELATANDRMENTHREIREINFALDKSNYLIKTDANGKIIYANEKYGHISKYPVQQLIGKQLFLNRIGGNPSVIYEHINDSLRRREVWQGEVYDNASDGSGFWLDVTLMPVVNNKSEVYQYLVICSDITKRKEAEHQLRKLMEEKLQNQIDQQKLNSYAMIMGQEKERKRVAAEIHDGIGQMLTSLRMKTEMVHFSDQVVNEKTEEILDLLKAIIDETRRICSDLLPSVLNDFGLSAAISELARNVEKDNGLKVRLENGTEDALLKKEVEIGVFRIVQEAVNNTMKHAKAGKLQIQLTCTENTFNMSVIDDGIGFEVKDKNKTSNRELANKNHGIRSMIERAQLLGGRLDIRSERNRGTKISLVVPLS